MANKKTSWGILVMAFALCGIFSSCWSTGKAREILPQTAVTIQRVRVSATLLGDLIGTDLGGLIGTENASSDSPMQIFIDHNEPLELANGASTTILVNNGEHLVYAVFGNVESKSVRFTANSRTITINVFPKRSVLGRVTLEIEVK